MRRSPSLGALFGEISFALGTVLCSDAASGVHMLLFWVYLRDLHLLVWNSFGEVLCHLF